MRNHRFSPRAAALILTPILALASLAFVASGALATTSPYVVAAWNMPSFTNDHTYSGPQTLAFSTTSDTADLGALDKSLLCGHAYQIDVYLNDETTASLLAGGVLTGEAPPWLETEHLAPGGQGVAYIAKITECASPSESVAPSESVTPSESVAPSESAAQSIAPVVTPIPSIPNTAMDLPDFNGPILLFIGFLAIGLGIIVIVSALRKSR